MVRCAPCWHMQLALLCLVLLVAQGVRGWSGANAYTVVLLTGTDTALRSAFYDAPAGTVLDVFAENGAAEVGRSGGEAILSATPAPTALTHASWPNTPPRLPYRVALSDEWVVLEQPARVARGEAAGQTLLLHCRLPLQRDAATERAARARFVMLYEPQYRDAIAAWWRRRVTQGRGSGCLHGQGEGSGTGCAPRFYSLCPTEGLWRVRHLTLLAALYQRQKRMTHTVLSDDEANGTRRVGDSTARAPRQPPLSEYCPRCVNHTRELPRRVMKFLGEMHKSRAGRHAVLSDPPLSAAFERVGEYDLVRSLPRWNVELRVWEMLYPSTQPCSAHFGRTHGESPGMTQSAKKDGRTWRTLVRLRCAPAPTDISRDAGLREWQTVHHWTITEVRQTCRYEVELSTHVVCEWERALDALQVNPVPCVPLS